MFHTSEHTGPDKLFQRFPGPAFSELKSLLLWDSAATVTQKWDQLHSCAYSFMLYPTERLLHVRGPVLSTATIDGGGGGGGSGGFSPAQPVTAAFSMGGNVPLDAAWLFLHSYIGSTCVLQLNPFPFWQLEAEFVWANHVTRAADGLLGVKLLHARLGDGSMHVKKAWTWSAEKRPSVMWNDPLAALGCFDNMGTGAPVG